MANDTTADLGALPIPLPSKGALYKDMPGGVLTINRMKARELALIFSAGSAEQRLTKLIAATCVLPKGMGPNDLLTVDRMAILIAARSKTFGVKYDFEYECQACGSKQKHTVDISHDLRQNEVPEMAEPFEVVLPDCGKTIGLRFLRGYDEDAVAKEAKKMAMSSVDPGDTSALYRVARLIQSIDGNDKLDIIQKQRFVDEMPAGDFVAIENEIEAREPGIDLTVHPECARCQAVNELKMPFDREFFRPAAHRARHA